MAQKGARPKGRTPKRIPATEGNLTVDQWTALRAEYADWLLDPERVGTQQEWALAHKVSEFTVARWKHHPEVQGLLAGWRARKGGEFALAAANMLRLALGDGPQAVAAFKAIAEVMGENAPQKIDVTGRMTLADFLAKGGFTQDETAARARSH